MSCLPACLPACAGFMRRRGARGGEFASHSQGRRLWGRARSTPIVWLRWERFSFGSGGLFIASARLLERRTFEPRHRGCHPLSLRRKCVSASER